ncbi:hypothetical protein [Halohasta salina]|uniref:hypothetical protein n=1 Tax=Halohasta salina TaxID=2961621 RepID=UPI0020A31334|nr:hypothetical protein [Halohasta salina]
MVDTKTLLRWAGLAVAGLIVARLVIWLLGVVVGIVFGLVQLALTLLFVGLLVYGLYWGYTTFVSDSTSTARSREKVFER